MSEGIGFARRNLIERIINQNFDDDKANFNRNELLFVIQELLDEEGKKYFEGRTTKKGYAMFRQLVELLLYRNIANYDSMILITSEKGTGKSSAAMMIARQWCKLIGIKFSPAKHIAYNNADLMNKIDNLRKFEPVICDESVRFASACITGDTIIKTPNGNIPIKKLVDNENFKVYSFNKKTKKEEIKTAKKCLKIKKDVVYEITTKDGTKIQATKEHKFLTNNGWKRLEELTNGDKLVGV